MARDLSSTYGAWERIQMTTATSRRHVVHRSMGQVPWAWVVCSKTLYCVCVDKNSTNREGHMNPGTNRKATVLDSAAVGADFHANLSFDIWSVVVSTLFCCRVHHGCLCLHGSQHICSYLSHLINLHFARNAFVDFYLENVLTWPFGKVCHSEEALLYFSTMPLERKRYI